MPVWLIVLTTAIGTYLLIMIVRQFITPEKTVRHELNHLYKVDEEQFLRSVGNLLPPAILQGNKITPLINGDQIFPAMLDGIRSARKTITFETFIYWSGKIGGEFASALTERARAGVKVHVLLDWLGSNKVDEQLLRMMTDAGASVERYHPLRWYNVSRINNRTHRKLLVIDGRIGFTGGVGIADEWLGNAQDADHWRDSHFKLEGPAVAQMQSAFMDNWMTTEACVLHGDEYFPKLEPEGESPAQVFQSSPEEGAESVRLMYLLSITAAAHSIRLGTAYFVPDDLTIDAIVAARKRGVRVEIIVPGKNIDTQTVRRASRSRWGPLLEAGVDIFEYQPTMYHCKVVIVDDLWVSVGSTNFDNRSFRLNDEANLNVYDRDLAAHQTQCFEQDKTRSKQITLEAWKSRPLQEKAIEHLAGLLRWQL
ncbi:MAG: cardiolipin synthase [Anaerolineae bacterium]|nr:cardiolipin synthase [Phycisphaerae bacterium]